MCALEEGKRLLIIFPVCYCFMLSGLLWYLVTALCGRRRPLLLLVVRSCFVVIICCPTLLVVGGKGKAQSYLLCVSGYTALCSVCVCFL